ncbi:alkylation response protein AidB-like acyl-CoA dehydrogenase [Streptomyces umbrinus]|uniref:Alkylation response protein AidB-like acyl-CoA dehydrogenase n=1 Tax=Streptomyces umbrinus TaxID=67370 RepID=A0ABU0T6R9_9ACTN|nr:acyl-CoA dehydrogenase family protein [Streptomyces umbrinus]MDQ1031485.1 alkylation response protein AidB-like acyl-CoA dehydrogenase [Streptomyces umbrinus]
MPAASLSLTRPYLTDDHQPLQQQIQDIVNTQIAPLAPQMEERGPHTDREVRRMLSETGWLGVLLGPDEDGMDAGHVVKTWMLAEVARRSAAASAILQASILGAAPIAEFGDEAMRRDWLPDIAAGRIWPTIATTEPVAGSHVLGMETTAHRKGQCFVLNGEKDLVGNADLGDVHCVIARTGKRPGAKSLTAFLVEKNTPGLEVVRRPLNGLHGFSADGLRLSSVHVPRTRVIGEIGDGLAVALLSSVVYGRLNLAAVALGIHQRLLDVTKEWVSTRPRYKGHLSDLPPVRNRIAEMQGQLMSAQLAAYHAAYLLDEGIPCDAELIYSKLTSHRAGVASAEHAKQLHGGHAGRLGNPCEQLRRDMDLVHAPAGPDDLQLIRLAEQALGPSRTQWSARHLSHRHR